MHGRQPKPGRDSASPMTHIVETSSALPSQSSFCDHFLHKPNRLDGALLNQAFLGLVLPSGYDVRSSVQTDKVEQFEGL